MNRFICAAAALLSFATAPAQAAVVNITTAGTWTVVDETVGVGNFLTDSYKATTALTLRFTDLFFVGDTYDVYKNGIFQFSATSFNAAGAFNSDPATAYSSGVFTRGTIALAANDIVSFKITAIPAGFSDSTIAVSGIATTNAVPEPATWALMISGFGLVGSTMRRRRSHVALAA